MTLDKWNKMFDKMNPSKRILLFLLWFIAVALPVSAQVNIWAGTSTSARVMMTSYLAPGSQNPAVVVCPGGSYFWHDTQAEGEMVGMWLQSQGISAFVLRYRTAYVPAFITHFRLFVRGNRYPDPLHDLQRALQYVRSRADSLGVDASRVGAMGFSAGGHLVMLAAEQLPVWERPRFVVPVYPVVTMTQPCVHKRSRRGLLGDSRTGNKALRELLSLENHVPDDCPPVFLVNCKDDPIVDYRNAALLDSALTAHAVPHQYIQYARGGHGFGASPTKGMPECRAWKERFIQWFRQLKL